MNGYSWISGISIFCYLFLLLSFLSSRKKERVIKSFEVLLVIMILWTGGSVGMRLQIWPHVNFWHHVSLLGMLLLPFGYYQFLLDFLDERSGFLRYFLFVFFIAVFVFNCFTGFFIPLPEVIQLDGQIKFLYHYNWHIYLLVCCIAFVLMQIMLLIWRFCRGNHLALQQLWPVIVGVVIIFGGNVIATLPVFVGIPVDMLSGALNAIFLFYALYRKKLFRISILFSKSNYVILAMIFGCAIFFNIANAIRQVLVNNVGLSYTTALIIIALFFVAMTIGMYFIINFICDAVFARPEKKKQEMLNRFSEEIMHMLSVSEILQLLGENIQEVVKLDRLFVLVKGIDGHYRIEHTINPLDEKSFYFRADHPLMRHFKIQEKYVLMQDFSRQTIYRSMWEIEKQQLTNHQIDCAIPLNCGDALIGCILLSGKQNDYLYKENLMNFLQNMADVCSVAVNNAYTYERAIAENQKDELTGLINYKFFFEILDREFEKNKDTALSLCLINIDDFKLYNQLYGTQEGDLALQRIATTLSTVINDDAYAARISGDGFALILPGYDVYSAKCMADNIAEQVAIMNVSDIAGRLTVSIGICAAPYMASSARELYRNAETTVYTVKRTGKNAVQMYSEDINRRLSSNTTHKSGYTENAGTIYALTAAIDAKDHYTFRHSQNVAYYAAELAKAAGMDSYLVEVVREAGLLHDIGKIGIREDILNKPDKLTAEEFDAMKGHVENAVNIIRHLPSLDYVIPAVLSHHERYDGRGYPRSLAGDNIPITGRILTIADSFDAITSARNYKPATPLQEAISILRSEAGKQFDPNLVEIFVEQLENEQIMLQYSDGKSLQHANTL